jgi:hypothetical protein
MSIFLRNDTRKQEAQVIATQHTSVQALERRASLNVTPAGIAFYGFQDQNHL